MSSQENTGREHAALSISLQEMLSRLGYEGTRDEQVAAYCEFHQLAGLDSRDASLVKQNILSRQCLVPDRVQIEEAVFPESCREIGHYIAWQSWPGDSAMGVTKEEFLQALWLGWSYHNEAINVGHYFEPDHEKARVRIRFERLVGSTLAWS